jgi:paraquat-inducible protein A
MKRLRQSLASILLKWGLKQGPPENADQQNPNGQGESQPANQQRDRPPIARAIIDIPTAVLQEFHRYQEEQDRVATIGCHDCGSLQSVPRLEPGLMASCRRCGATLFQPHHRPFHLGLALTLTAAALSLPALLTPIFVIHVYGRNREDLVYSGVTALWTGYIWPLALMVAAFAIVIPIVWTSSLLVVFGSLIAHRQPWWLGFVFRMSRALDVWMMPDVFMVGAIVAYTRLRSLALVDVAAGGWCFIGFALSVLALRTLVDPQQIWVAIGHYPNQTSGDLSNSVACHGCALVLAPSAAGRLCPRCLARVELRNPDAYQRTVALVIAAYILYVPANLLPVLSIVRFGTEQASTILEGVHGLLESGMWPLALIVFLASIAVPIIKLFGLTWLLISTRQRDSHRLVTRTRTYRAIDLIGRWSNVDVFAISILTALLQFDVLITVRAEPGAVAFGAVVLLTMLASRMFDPRIMWDVAAKGDV